MNTYASQHPADKTPLYEPVHATGGLRTPPKRALHEQLRRQFLVCVQAFRKDETPSSTEMKRLTEAHIPQFLSCMNC